MYKYCSHILDNNGGCSAIATFIFKQCCSIRSAGDAEFGMKIRNDEKTLIFSLCLYIPTLLQIETLCIIYQRTDQPSLCSESEIISMM